MAKEGSTVSGLMDSFATAISLALQHGVPLKVLCEKFAHSRFEPSGWTGNEHIGYRQVDHGLHLPLAPAALPLRATALPVRRTGAARLRASGDNAAKRRILPLSPEQHSFHSRYGRNLSAAGRNPAGDRGSG